MHLVADVLDKQLLDVTGKNAGRADGVVLELRDGAPPRLAYVEVGPITLIGRLSTRLARWYARLGRRAYDLDGRIVGRIEEIVVEPRDAEYVVTEYHLGAAALIERLALSAALLPFLRLLPLGERVEYRVPWNQMDLTDPKRPRVTV